MTPAIKELLDGLEGVTPGPYHKHEWEGILKQTDVRDAANRTVLQVPWDRDTGCSAHRDAAHFARCSPENLRPILELALEAHSLSDRAVELEKANAALETNCRDFNEAGLEALKQRDEALRNATFWEKLSNQNSDSADTWKARAEAAESEAHSLAERVKVLEKALEWEPIETAPSGKWVLVRGFIGFDADGPVFIENAIKHSHLAWQWRDCVGDSIEGSRTVGTSRTITEWMPVPSLTQTQEPGQ